MMWTAERVELLEKLWGNGVSTPEIAQRLGKSIDSVRSKISRLVLPERPRVKYARLKHGLRVSEEKRRAKSKSIPGVWGHPEARAVSQKVAPSVPAEDLAIPPAERKNFDALEENHCRWPMGDPRATAFHFCGKEKVRGFSYCEFHARRAFQPPTASPTKTRERHKRT